MSRVARIVVPGYPHHITQRGNRQSAIFETDADRESYLRFLDKYAALHGLSLWAYCLMTNHIHLVAVPKWGMGCGIRIPYTPCISTAAPPFAGMCGRAVFTLARWMTRTCGQRSGMWNVIRLRRDWLNTRRTIAGQARPPIVAYGLTPCCPSNFLRQTS